MEQYPSIVGSSKAPKDECIAFYKYDGSNLRFEWTRKAGWNKFGTRNCLFDETDKQFGEAIAIFNRTLAEPLVDIFKREFRNVDKITVFCEFFGKSSFAGQHKEDEEHQLVLIDVKPHKKGYISPREFVNIFGKKLGDLAAQVVYEGNLNAEFIDDVRNGKYNAHEGVVCKGGSGHKLWRCKIKTKAYLEELKKRFTEDWELFWE
jgi:hypothetical protein